MEVFLGDPEPFPWQDFFLENTTINGGMAPVRRCLRHFYPGGGLLQGRPSPAEQLLDGL